MTGVGRSIPLARVAECRMQSLAGPQAPAEASEAVFEERRDVLALRGAEPPADLQLCGWTRSMSRFMETIAWLTWLW